MKKRRSYLILITGGILSALFLLFIFAINPTLEKMLANQIESKLLGNFNYTYKSLSVNLWTGSVSFDEVKWSFPNDTAAIEHAGNIDRISISGISLRILTGDTDIRIDEILFVNPEMLFKIIDGPIIDDTLEVKNEYIKFNFFSLFQGKINSLSVGSIIMENGNATWFNLADNKVRRKINKAHLIIDDIELDAEIAEDNNGWFILGNVHLDCAGGEMFLPDSLHKIKTGRILLDYKESAITIDSLALLPLFSRETMSKAYKYEIDWIDLFASQVRVSNIGLHTLMTAGKLRIDNISVDELSLTTFRDKKQMDKPKHYLPFPQMALKNLGVNIKIDSVQLRNATINYEELSELTNKSGIVYFKKINADIFNITNDSLSYIVMPNATMKVNAKLMGNIDLKADFVFDLTNNFGSHHFKGSLKGFDLTTFNPVFEPLAAVSIRKGTVENINFNIYLNDYVADGTMNFIYSDLKIDMLDKVGSKNKRFNKKLTGLLANTFVVKNSNPSGKREPRVGIIHYKRPQDKSMFYFWNKALLTGVKSTLISSEESR